jgi:hypothetical protein
MAKDANSIGVRQAVMPFATCGSMPTLALGRAERRTDKRMLTDSLWEDAMPLCIAAKVY